MFSGVNEASRPRESMPRTLCSNYRGPSDRPIASRTRDSDANHKTSKKGLNGLLAEKESEEHNRQNFDLARRRRWGEAPGLRWIQSGNDPRVHRRLQAQE